MEASPTNVTIVLPHLVEMLLSEVNNSFYQHNWCLHLSVIFASLSLSPSACMFVCLSIRVYMHFVYILFAYMQVCIYV